MHARSRSVVVALVLTGCPGSASDGSGGIQTGPSPDETGDSDSTGGPDGSSDDTAPPTSTTPTTDPTTLTSSTDPTGPTTPGDSSSGGGMLDCDGDVLDTLPIDASGWVPRECTPFDIQGAWYCFDDGMTDTSCVDGATPFQNDGMCLSGTALGPMPSTWGGGIGLSLNESGGAMSMKMPYDAEAHEVVGFAVEVSGDTGSNELRIGFTGTAAPTGPSPFVPVPGAGSYEIMLADALVPASWNVPEAGDTVDPTSIYDVQVQIAADGVAGPFDFCITSMTPILAGGGDTEGDDQPPPYGDEVCGQFATITLTDQYLVHNNVWNDAVAASGGSQCISALWDGDSDVAGFVVEPSFSLDTPAPGSYPSLIYGWHYNYAVPGSYDPQTIASIDAIPSTWSWDVPNAGRWNVAYDLWVHADDGATTPNGGLEIMIWTATRDTSPIGTDQGYTVDVGGGTWEVWYGSAGAWNTVTYRRTANTSSVDMDLLPFVEHAVSEGWAQNGWYLLGVEAGFEIWESDETMTTTSFHVHVE